MKPLRIRAEGFSAYRLPVDVDLEDVDFFSLTGATGSGKSSLIDAVVFALYGRVPRLGGNAVAPAISAGADQAKVAFDFEVDGVEYTAVRFAERNKSGGASVREARLQRGESVVADGSDNMTTEVEELLKLRFEDFTRTVVLPQGEFAQFLTATKSERQSLLRNLLGLEVFTVVRDLAKTRAAVARDRAETAQKTLDALEIPGDQALSSAETRLTTFEVLSTEIVEREKTLSTLGTKVLEAQNELDRLSDALSRLDTITAPDQLEILEGLANDARDDVTTAAEALRNVQTELTSLETQLGEMPPPSQVSSQRQIHETYGELEQRIATHDLTSLEAEVEAAVQTFDEASSRLQEIRASLANARVSHAAHTLMSTLVVGEPCPVCQHNVTEIPEADTPSEVERLEEGEANEVAVREQARLNLDNARGHLTRVEATLSEQTGQLQRLGESVKDIPSVDVLVELQVQYQELSVLVEERRADMAVKETRVGAAQKSLDDLADAVRRVDKQLTAAQLGVADLEPPVSEADDVVVRWKELLIWRDETRTDVLALIAQATESVVVAKVAVTQSREDLIATLRDGGVAPAEPFSAQVAGELEKARQMVKEHQKTLVAVSGLQKESDESSSQADVAEALVGHLRANGFEQWLMAGALADLVAGANGLLGQLSSGGYSLDSDDAGSFSIVDHHNADEMRSVSTLSGGETFLVSLALALSLAETLAAAGGAKLDTIILDEGFGTLDSESLDTVASVLEELAGEGLMVGVITHVKELASRATTRFEVTREPTGSTVAKVS